MPANPLPTPVAFDPESVKRAFELADFAIKDFCLLRHPSGWDECDCDSVASTLRAIKEQREAPERAMLRRVAETQMALAACDADMGRAAFADYAPDDPPPTQEERDRLDEEADDAIADVLAWYDAPTTAADSLPLGREQRETGTPSERVEIRGDGPGVYEDDGLHLPTQDGERVVLVRYENVDWMIRALGDYRAWTNEPASSSLSVEVESDEPITINCRACGAPGLTIERASPSPWRAVALRAIKERDEARASLSSGSPPPEPRGFEPTIPDYSMLDVPRSGTEEGGQPSETRGILNRVAALLIAIKNDRDLPDTFATWKAEASALLPEFKTPDQIRAVEAALRSGVPGVARSDGEDAARRSASAVMRQWLEEADAARAERHEWLAKQAAVIAGSVNGRTVVRFLPVGADDGAHRFAVEGDGWSEEFSGETLNDAIDAARSHSEHPRRSENAEA